MAIFVFISREIWLTSVLSLISLLYKSYSPLPTFPITFARKLYPLVLSYYRTLKRHSQVYHDLHCLFLFPTTEKTVWRRAYPRGGDKQTRRRNCVVRSWSWVLDPVHGEFANLDQGRNRVLQTSGSLVARRGVRCQV